MVADESDPLNNVDAGELISASEDNKEVVVLCLCSRKIVYPLSVHGNKDDALLGCVADCSALDGNNLDVEKCNISIVAALIFVVDLRTIVCVV